MDVCIKNRAVIEAHADELFSLQELIAPREVLFFNSAFQLIGNKNGLDYFVSKATGISKDHLLQGIIPTYTPVAVRMRWASKRISTRVEDLAYSLLGIFNINMPLLYGEGERAFRRLQIEIIRQSDDESVFFWERNYFHRILITKGLLAPDASCFSEVFDYHVSHLIERQHYEVTNKGIRITCYVPNDLVKDLSSRRRLSAIILMPLNLSKMTENQLDEWENLIPCLRFSVKTYQPSMRSPSDHEHREVKYLKGLRESLEMVTVPRLFNDWHIEMAARGFKTLGGHNWDAFCGDHVAATTAIPVYFRPS